MAESSVKVIMTGDASKLLAEQAKAQRKERDTARAIGETGKAAGGAERQAIALQEKLIRISTPKIDKLNQDLAFLKRRLAEGKISQQDFDRATAHVNQQLANERNKLGQVETAIRKTGKTASEASKSTADSVVGIVSTAGTVITGVVGAAVAGLKQLQDIHNEIAARASEGVTAEADTGGALSQLGTTPEQRERLRKVSEQIFVSGATQTADAQGRRAAGEMAFSLESAGLTDELQTFIDAGRSRLFSPDQLNVVARSITALTNALGKQEVGSVEDILSKGILASAVNPEDVPSLIEAAAQAGAAAKTLGVSDEDLLTATGIAASVTGSAAEAGTQLEAFLSALAKGGSEGIFPEKGLTIEAVRGKSIPEMVQAVQQLNLPDEELIGAFGRKEGFKFFQSITQNFDKTQQLLSDVQRAPQEQVFQQRVAANLQDRNISIELVRRQSEARAMVASDEAGRMKILADAVQNQRTERRRREEGDFSASLNEFASNAFRKGFGPLPGAGDRKFLESVNLGAVDEQTQRLINETVNRQSFSVDRGEQFDAGSAVKFAQPFSPLPMPSIPREVGRPLPAVQPTPRQPVEFTEEIPPQSFEARARLNQPALTDQTFTATPRQSPLPPLPPQTFEAVARLGGPLPSVPGQAFTATAPQPLPPERARAIFAPPDISPIPMDATRTIQTVQQTEPDTRTALAPPPAPAQRGRGDSPSRVPAGHSFNADNSDVVRAVNAQTRALDSRLNSLISAMSNNSQRFREPSFTAPSIRSQQLSEAANVD